MSVGDNGCILFESNAKHNFKVAYKLGVNGTVHLSVVETFYFSRDEPLADKRSSRPRVVWQNCLHQSFRKLCFAALYLAVLVLCTRAASINIRDWCKPDFDTRSSFFVIRVANFLTFFPLFRQLWRRHVLRL